MVYTCSVLYVVCLDVLCEDVSQFNSNNVNIVLRSSSTQPVRSCIMFFVSLTEKEAQHLNITETADQSIKSVD